MASKAKHSRGRLRARRWWVAAAAAVLVAGGAAAAVLIRNGSSATAQHSGASSPSTNANAALVARLASSVTVTPAPGATQVPLDTPVTVATAMGTIRSVEVVSSADGTLPGAISTSGTQWQSSGALDPGVTYLVTVSIVGDRGLSAQVPSSFSTLTPTYKVTGSLYPFDGSTVGVGQPIVVHFSRSVRTPAAQSAVLSHLTVTSSMPITGGWHWFSPTELHFRPQVYWPTGDQVSVASDLRGWDAGAGAWGSGQVNVRFKIGDAHISVADLGKDLITVTDNGKQIGSYPISGGRTQYPTMTGTHIALDKSNVVIMDSATIGIPKGNPDYYYEKVYWDVRISDSGEFVHAAPWSTGSQGRSNVSHGCINLSTDRAQTFFNFSQVGDVIQVVDGPRPPVAGDHGVMDWSLAWSQWTPATVQVPPAPTTTTSTTPANTTTVATPSRTG
ncbi:MAG: Ig-like domain-containing protein [Acidimicrobiales bacterium]